MRKIMKKNIFILWVLMTVAVFAQTDFYAYKLTVVDNSTNEIVQTIETNLIIKLFNDKLAVVGKTVLVWILDGPVYDSDATSFYSYALDEDNVKCRIWFKVYDEQKCAFGVEYSDYSFLYSCTVN